MKDAWICDMPLPFPEVEVKLPDKAGTIRARLKAAKIEKHVVVGLQVEHPTWTRWSTQTTVGEHSLEGIGPGTATMWVPLGTVLYDEDDGPRIRECLYSQASVQDTVPVS